MDIIAAIDAVTGCQYPPCGRQLDDSSPSPDFCSPQHQAAWLAARTVPLTADYDEPEDLPVHVGNLVELHSPETCALCAEGAPAAHRWLPDGMWRPGVARINGQTCGHLSGEAVWSGLIFDRARDAPLTDLTVLRGGEIRVNIVPDMTGFDAGMSRLGEMARRLAGGTAAGGPFPSRQPTMRSFAEEMARDVHRAAQQAADDYQRSFAAMWAVMDVPVDFAPWNPTPSVDTSRLSGATFDLAHIDLVDVTARGEVTADMIRDIRQAAQPRWLSTPADVRQRALRARRNRNTGPPPPKRRAPRQLPPRRSR